jgi:tetratricopeptide (TPR) repeat protein
MLGQPHRNESFIIDDDTTLAMDKMILAMSCLSAGILDGIRVQRKTIFFGALKLKKRLKNQATGAWEAASEGSIGQVAEGPVLSFRTIHFQYDPGGHKKSFSEELMKKAICLVLLSGLLSLSALYAQGMKSDSTTAISEVSKVISVADTLAARKAFDLAIPEYRKALTLSPNDYAIHNKLGICYQRMLNLGSARKEFETTMKLNPKFAEAVNNLGTVNYMDKNYKLAIKQYKKALTIKPELAAAYCNMGSVYFDLQKYKEGTEAYKKAIALNPSILEHSMANGITVRTLNSASGFQYYLFAKICAASGMKDQALIYLAKAQEYGFKDFGKITKDPDFKAVVEDARYEEIVKSGQAKL